jgi:hypothetical protein
MLGAQEIEETFTGLFRSSEAYKSDETNETLITPAVPKMRINPAIARVNLRLVALATIVITLFAVLTCRASASSTFSYALTTTTDPARPGQMVQFELTASNLTNAAQYLSVGYLVPQFTTSINGYAAGTALTYTFGYIPAGVSQSIYLDFKVLNGTQAPPDGSLVNLVVSDPARSASVSRTAMVKSAPAALDLSTQQGSVAPGGSFSYTLAYHNASSSSLSGSQLSLPIPVGATFVSADGGGVKGTDGVVRWSPSALGAGATGEVHLSLKSSTTPAIQAALLIQAAWRNSSSQILAQASDAKAVYASPAFSYAMTTTTDPVKPGQVVQFRLTASNLTNAAQYLSVGYHVPQFTTSINGYAAGTALSCTFGYIAEGTTEAVYLDFKVLSSTQNPPDGSLVTLEISDQATGASVSRTAMVKSAPAAALDLSTQQGSVAPGGSFSYTLAYHNASSSSLSGSQLSLPIPVGATFVSADGGGIKGTDGVVRWSPSVLGAGATGEVHLSLKSSTTPAIQAALPIQAAWTNSSSQILAQASDAKAVYASPALSYALTTTDPVKPGQVVQFKLTASNLTNAAQYLSVGYHVPQFTTSINGYAAGTALSYTFGYIAAGTSEAVDLDFKVLSSTQNPPDGSLVTLEISNQASGASVSRTATVKSAPAAALDLSTQQGSVAPGGSFSYTLAYHNASSSSLSGSQLSLPIPVGATLVSADGGGVKGTDGVVRWSPSVLGAGATGEVHLSLKSSTTPAIQAALLIEAAWTNSSSQILARASDAKAVYASPAFSYGLTASGPAIPGHAIQFKLTVTNATNAAQYLSVGYHVPQFTTSTTGYAAGTALSYTFGNVAAGASQSVTLSFNVLSGTQTPPNGSLVTLVISDQARAVTVSRTSAINQTIALIDWTDSFSRNLVLIFQGEPLAFRYSPFSDLGQDSRTIVAGGVSGDCISL